MARIVTTAADTCWSCNQSDMCVVYTRCLREQPLSERAKVVHTDVDQWRESGGRVPIPDRSQREMEHEMRKRGWKECSVIGGDKCDSKESCIFNRKCLG